MTNLADDPALADVVSDLHGHLMNGWEPEEIRHSVLESQRRRKLIKSVPGEPPQWDYIARTGDAERYVRKDGVDPTKSRLRLPRVAEVPPDWSALDTDTVSDLIAGRRSISDFLKLEAKCRSAQIKIIGAAMNSIELFKSGKAGPIGLVRK